jgi:hypothetical protein
LKKSEKISRRNVSSEERSEKYLKYENYSVFCFSGAHSPNGHERSDEIVPRKQR